MKNRKMHASFVDNLRRKVRSLKNMKPEDVHVFTINASYGHYQVIIGPKKGHNQRDVRIEGEIHHLFVSPHSINANPSKHEIYENMKNTIIMRDLEVHLHDPKGDGKSLEMKTCDAHPKEYINLAGKNGELLMKHIDGSRKLSLAAYRIIQEDILHALKKEETTAD